MPAHHVYHERKQVRCRRCNRLVRAHASTALRLCGMCEVELRRTKPDFLKRLRRMRRIAKLPKRRTHLKLQQSNSGGTDQFHVSVPAYVVRELKWAKGQRLRISAAGGRVELVAESG